MSEQRVYDFAFTKNIAREKGKILHDSCLSHRYECFGAYQFKLKHNRIDNNFTPTVPILSKAKAKWYRRMYRVRIDGKWYNPSGGQYEFFTEAQIGRMLLKRIVHVV